MAPFRHNPDRSGSGFLAYFVLFAELSSNSRNKSGNTLSGGAALSCFGKASCLWSVDHPWKVLTIDAVQTISETTLCHFVVISSTMHNAWMRSIRGRLKSDYRYSASIAYNSVPRPDPSDEQRAAVEAAGHTILDARAQQSESSLANLCDFLAMRPELRKVYAANDRAVDAAYGYQGNKFDAARVAFVFGLYNLISRKV